MSDSVSASFVNLTHEATLRSFWRRRTLWRFLRQHRISETFLSGWDTSESKRDFLDRLFAKLPTIRGGPSLILSIARDLAQQDTFPDLQGWENSAEMMKQAERAVAELRTALAKLDDQVISDREQREARERLRRLHEEASRSRASLESLDQRLKGLAAKLGTAEAGYEFQTWFFDLMEHFEVLHRRPYVSSGRQIDGSITVSGTTYLVELKFTAEPASATDIDSLHKKVTEKADNTMGVMVSVSGYSAVAVSGASGPKSLLLLLDHGHIYLALAGTATFSEIVDRIRRHASQTGDSFLPAASFHE
jgi:hypothetical protein